MNVSIMGVNFMFETRSNIRKTLYSALEKKTGYVCFPNANVVIESKDNMKYKNILNNSLFNICDGTAPRIYANLIYKLKVSKYTGPDLMLDTFRDKNDKLSHYFLGSDQKTLKLLEANLKIYENKISGAYSPPYLKVDQFDYQSISKRIILSGANLVWVSLGAPKQEIFMSRLLPYLEGHKVVLMGIGAALDFHAGTLTRAPIFFQERGMEWLYRIYKEPRRLFFRYMYVNFKFMTLLFVDLIKSRVAHR
jgi:exopolysaccharide biosynthesis WecB/TagA/CpsF family protein